MNLWGPTPIDKDFDWIDFCVDFVQVIIAVVRLCNGHVMSRGHFTDLLTNQQLLTFFLPIIVRSLLSLECWELDIYDSSTTEISVLLISDTLTNYESLLLTTTSYKNKLV